MQESQYRRSSLPHRSPSKHVVFSAVLQGDKDGSPITKDVRDNTVAHDKDIWPLRNNHYVTAPGTYAFDQVPTLVKTPWEQQRPVKRWSWPSRRPAETYSRRSPSKPFDGLPDEIYNLILKHVDDLHQKPAGVCVSCILHDTHSLSGVSKAWHKAANKHMYRTIWLLPHHHTSRLPRRNRVKLLLRTLEELPSLAGQVEYIYAAIGHEEAQPEQRRRVPLAAIIATCPNLKALRGFHPTSSGINPPDEMNVVLATRRNLREYMWLLEGRSDGPQRLCPFIQYPNEWSSLETLVIRDRDSLLGQGSIYPILRQLPALQQLALMGLSSSAFHDGTLQALQGLKSLRLEALIGLTDLGLEQPLPRLAGTLRKLSLVDLDIKSLRTLSKLLTNFSKLQRFTIVQDNPPGLPLGAHINLAKELPLLHSQNLTYLHWEMLVPGSANDALETSIRSGGFPSLRSLRAPCDSDGTLQSLCRPVERLKVSEAETREYRRRDSLGYTRDLTHARTAAQLRTRASSDAPAVSVVIQEEGYVQYTQVMGRYLGNIQSQISYNLESDFDGTKQALGNVGDLLHCGTLECSENRKGRGKHVVIRARTVQSLF